MRRSQMEKDVREAEQKLDREKALVPTKDNLAIKIVRIVALVVLLTCP